MISIRDLETTFTGLIEGYLECPVIRSNQVKGSPGYPYVAYTIIQPLVANRGHYGVTAQTKTKPIKQVWSFTCLADEQEISQQLALDLHTYLDELGSMDFYDAGIVVQKLGNVASRDVLLTVGYEYRNGFDVTLTTMQMILPEEELHPDEVIEKIIFNKEET